MEQTWQVKYRSNDTYTLAYDGQFIIHKYTDGSFKKREKRWSIEDFFREDFHYNIKIAALQTEVRKHIATTSPLPPNASLALQYKYEFWQALNLDKLVLSSHSYRYSYPNIHVYYNIHLTKEVVGYTLLQAYDREHMHKNIRFLDDFFFDGPTTLGTPLNVRKEIKLAIWNALDKDKISFSLKDSFPLFDYKKIEKHSAHATVDHEDEDEIIEHSLYVRQGHIDLFTTFGDVSYRDNRNRSSEYSIEFFWKNMGRCIYPVLEEHKPMIRDILQAAII
ncbi:MAG: hypothetical protein GY810_14875 [Aureispira sp.]|nr:hypothetical protein [Aureispira sp.]